MIEDSALSLKKAYEKGENITIEDAHKILERSELIKKLLNTPLKNPNLFSGLRGYMWRLLELSEIPYTFRLEKVQSWLKLLVDKSYIKEGFSLEGKKDNLLACHNALITTILLKMNFDDKAKIDAGINWILTYQEVERGVKSKWSGSDLYTRFGGCMKKVPCFYGIVKSMIALTEYKKKFGTSKRLDEKLNQGLEYILKHKVYKKLSTGKPIEDSIILNFYPYTYRSNIIEILSLLKTNDLIFDELCKDALNILRKKQRNDGYWQADTSYMKSGWIDFDIPKKPGLWISYIISKLVNT
ncbi:MAG: hypothetical protein ACW972_06790 [Promethearchaeota archaeon]|jgi:hypothetical protein